MVIRRTLRFSWHLGALLVVLTALAMLAGRALFPLLEAYPATVERMVQERTGYRLAIGEMEFGWSAFGPEMRFHDVALRTAQGAAPLIAVEELGIGLDLVRTLLEGRVIARRIRLEGTSLNLIRTADGRLHLEGAPEAGGDFLSLLLAQPRLQARRVRLQFRDERRLPGGVRIHDLSVDLRSDGDRRQLWFDFRPEEAMGRRVRGGFDLSGWEKGPGALSGRWYLEGQGIGVAAAQKRFFPDWRWHAEGMADIALWGDVRAGAVVEILGRASLRLPSLRRPDEVLPVFVAGRLDALARWRRGPDGQRLDVASLRIQQASQPYWETGATLRWRPEADGWRLRCAIDRLDTRLFSGLGRHLRERTPPRWRGLLEARGWLRDLQAAFRLDTRMRVHDLRLMTDFSVDLLPPSEGLPGLQNLAGRLRYGAGRGEARLGAEQLVIEMPRLFRARISLSRLAARVRWQSDAAGWRIRFSDVRLENRDFSLSGGGALHSVAGRSMPHADMDFVLHRGEVAAVPAYLPARVMSARTVEWLDRALIGGRITGGHVRLHGNLGDLPFDRGRGSLDILARVEDGALDYHPGWHRIEAIRADVRFVNQRMEIFSRSARILDVDLENVEVGILDLRRTPLTARGQARGAFGSMLRYVRESPLAQRGYPVERLRGGGMASLSLELVVPLHGQGERLQVAGSLQLEHDRLDIDGYPVTLEAIQGTVRFTDRGISGKDISARLWRRPVRIGIATLEDAEVTRIEIDGPIPVVARLAESGFPFRDRFSGEAHWHARLDVGRGAAGMQLTLSSGLEGIAIDLPDPIGKPAMERRGFRLATHIGGDGIGPLRIVYGAHSAALELARTGAFGIRRAAILFNAPAARLPESSGLWIGGRLKRLSLDAWRAVVAPGAARGLSLPPPERVRLEVGELVYLGVTWPKMRLALARDEQLWRLSLEGERVAGEIAFGLPPEATGLRLDLKHLDLPAFTEIGEKAQERLRPDRLPPLSVHVVRFAYQGTAWGRLDLVTRPLPGQGLKVESALLESDWLHAEAGGTWTVEAGRHYSRFHVRLRNTDLGRVLQLAGYGEQLDGGETTAELEANWPGPPWAFDLARIEGSLAITILDGRLLQLKPGAGRLLGLLNLQAIPRRLTLDFSDLFKKGFAFDRLEGHFTFVDGDAYTTDLVIEAPSARIEIAGRTGLVARDYDEVVTVTPHIRGGLPIAGAIAGGPAVGAALLLADRLLGEKLDRIGRVQYTVTGPWESPNFQRLEARE